MNSLTVPSNLPAYQAVVIQQLSNKIANLISELNFYKLIPYPVDRQDPPNRPRYQLTRALIGLDNEKYAMTSSCLDRKYARGVPVV